SSDLRPGNPCDPHHQRHVDLLVVHRREVEAMTALAERLAVVAREDDDGRRERAVLLERVEHPAERAIHERELLVVALEIGLPRRARIVRDVLVVRAAEEDEPEVAPARRAVRAARMASMAAVAMCTSASGASSISVRVSKPCSRPRM